MYLESILQKYAPRNLANYSYQLISLKTTLRSWASGCYLGIYDSGSRAKGTAISLASDVDYLISLTNDCNQNSGGLESIYNSLHQTLKSIYPDTRKQNVSIRIKLAGGSLFTQANELEVDITPARKQIGYNDIHSLYVSKQNTWRQTNIQKHIKDIPSSGRVNEIKLLKIWRELHKLDFPSIYLEYLLINQILPYCYYDLHNNFIQILSELAKDYGNPLFARIVDPANSNNILSDLLSDLEKNKIITKAKESVSKISYYGWTEVVW